MNTLVVKNEETGKFKVYRIKFKKLSKTRNYYGKFLYEALRNNFIGGNTS